MTWCLSLLLILGGVDEVELEPFQGTVTCRKVDFEEKLLEAKAGREKLELTYDESTRWLVHEAKKLEEVAEAGLGVAVLARRQGAQNLGAGRGNSPAMIVQVQAMIAGPFTPPKLTDKQREKKFEWIRGPLLRSGTTHYALGDTLIQVGGDRVVVTVVRKKTEEIAKKRTALRKGATMRIEGEKQPPEETEGKKPGPTRVTVEKVEILNPRAGKKEYPILYPRPPKQ